MNNRLPSSLFDAVLRGILFLLFLLVPLFFSLRLTNYSLPKVALLEVLVSLLLTLWFLRMGLEGRLVFERCALSVPLLVFLFIALLSLPFSLSPFGGLSLLGQIASTVALYFVVVHHLREEEIERWVLVFSATGLLVSAYGILQSAGLEPLLQGYEFLPFIPVSTLGHRNMVAQYLIVVIPLSGTFFLLTSWGPRKVLFGLATLSMTYCLFLTKSRGGIVGFTSALFLAFGVQVCRWARSERTRSENRAGFLKWLWVLPVGSLLFLFLPPSSTIRVEHLNPVGYTLGSVDTFGLSSTKPILIAFEYRVLQGSRDKAGQADLFSGRINSSPVGLGPAREGWNHVQGKSVLTHPPARGEQFFLRWIPGSEPAALQFRNVTVQTEEGVPLMQSGWADRLFTRLGISEVDKRLSGQTRVYLYRNTLAMIKDHPFAGVGFGNFRYAYPRYRDRAEWALSGLNTRVDEAHNDYLQVFSEVGIVGFVVFLWILFLLGRMAWKGLQGEAGTRRFSIAQACVMGILATLVQCLFDFNLQNPASGMMFWSVVGFLEVVSAPRTPLTLSIPSRVIRCVIACGIVVAFAIATSFAVKSVAGDYYLKEGRTSMVGGDSERAFENLQKASRFTPRQADVFFHLGQSLVQLKDYEGAIEAYNRCIALHPFFIEAMNNLGTVYIKVGRIDEAIGEFERCIDINPYHPGLHNNLGYLYSKRGSLEKALESYRKALALDPDTMETHKNIGILYFYKLKEPRKAKSHWEKYLARNPDDPQADLLRREIEGINSPAGGRERFENVP